MKEVQEKIQKLQLIEENLSGYLQQKQRTQSEIMELESATKAMEDAKSGYKILGNIMVEQPKDVITKDIQEKLEKKKARIEAIEKQESHLKQKAEELQKTIMEQMKDGDVQ